MTNVTFIISNVNTYFHGFHCSNCKRSYREFLPLDKISIFQNLSKENRKPSVCEGLGPQGTAPVSKYNQNRLSVRSNKAPCILRYEPHFTRIVKKLAVRESKTEMKVPCISLFCERWFWKKGSYRGYYFYRAMGIKTGNILTCLG